MITLMVLAGAARADDDAAGGVSLTTLGWAPATQSVSAGRSSKIWAAPRRQRVVGALARDARVAWTAIIPGDRRCRAWLALAPRGFVCATDVRPSELAPTATVDVPLGRYADVRNPGADVYATVAAVRAGTPTSNVPGTTFVAVRDAQVTVDGVTYRKTDQGYIAARDLIGKTPTTWRGFDPRVEPPPQWPFAWVVPEAKQRDVPVRATPARRGAVVRRLDRRALVPVLEPGRRWTRIGVDEWVETARLRVATRTAPPAGVAADARWIDVDLDHQVLVAYEGTTPVYATLVSTGRKKYRTPIGVYLIRDKQVRTRMRSPVTSAQHWDVADVPWSMGFRKNFALHGAYWHDGFGGPRSHGCVNLAPADAQALYDWTGPAVPAGWHTRQVDVADPSDAAAATVVRLRDRRDQDPPWRDFDGTVLPARP
ncbi:MAG: L,D-transpeptidase [Kofleriaceae bacterium]